MAWVLLLQACIQVGQFQLRCFKIVIRSKIVIKFKACSPDVAWNYLMLPVHWSSSTHFHQSFSKCSIGAMLSWHHFSMPGDGRPRGEIETFVAQSGHVTGQRNLHLKSFGMEMQTYIHLILAFPLSFIRFSVSMVEVGIPIFSTTSPSSWGIEALPFLCPCWKVFKAQK